VIEKNLNPLDSKYQKKILGFLDGSLSTDDKAEFEAYVRTHPEFESQIKKKEDEILFLKSLIPAGLMSKETAESLNNEMKLSIFNLLRQEPKNFMERVKNTWEDWLNR
jgi:hypothetical protein